MFKVLEKYVITVTSTIKIVNILVTCVDLLYLVDNLYKKTIARWAEDNNKYVVDEAVTTYNIPFS